MQTNQQSIETDPQTQKIAFLNDRLRQAFRGGNVMMTAGINALPEDTQMRIFAAMRDFDKIHRRE